MTDTEKLLFYLGKGKGNATPQKVLAQACGWLTAAGKPNTRKVRHVCRSLRKEGVLAVSNKYGCYIAASDKEVADYKAARFAHIKGELEAVRDIDKGWEREIADELFRACRNCSSIIPRELTYCDADCRHEFHTRARFAGYASMGAA